MLKCAPTSLTLPVRPGINLLLLSSFLFLLLLSTLPSPSLQSPSPRPTILVIMADDLGSSDLSYRDPEMHTPNIDKMYQQGVKLTSSYMTYACTPSRAAFLTGVYGFHMGIQTQTMVFSAPRNNTLPLRFKFLPEHLKTLGYHTHYVGKWHLGFCDPKTTPTGRGFDTFYGLYNGVADYYTHISKKNGYDFHDDRGMDFNIDWSAKGTYSTFLFTNRTVDILEKHNQSEPLFIFLSYQAVHGPLQVPEEYITRYCTQLNDQPGRQKICGLTAAMDEGIGIINDSLKRLGYTDNLITLFVSDNGGPVNSGSSNWPLRGGKKTLWEGGTRVPTILVSDTYLPNAPYEWNGLMHAIDWLPTLAKAAKDDTAITGIDGVDNWQNIVDNTASARNHFVYNIDTGEKNTSAIRWRHWKLINNKPGGPDSWYNPPRNVPNTREPPRKYPEFMLFNLKRDPAETVDLLAKPNAMKSGMIKKAVDKMKGLLAKYTNEVEPPMFAVKMADTPFYRPAWKTGWCNVTM